MFYLIKINMKNIKKLFLSFFTIIFIWISFAQELNLWQFITTYFEKTTSGISSSYQYINLLYTNIPINSTLHTSLQKAIYLDAFPNIKIALPYNKTITEDYAAKIIYNDIWHLPPAKVNTTLTQKWMDKTFIYLDKVTNIVHEESRQQELIMKDVNRVLHNKYYNSAQIDEQELSYWAIKWMVDAANDPYTSFFPPEEASNFNDEMQWEFQWIGAYVEMKSPGKMYIISVFDNSPAKKSWLQWWDRIIAIDNKEITQYININTATSLIKWPAGSSVKLTILRDWTKKQINIKRWKIEIQSITTDMTNQTQCKIKIHMFDYKVYNDFLEALSESEENNCQSFIIDLRNNPWGSLEEVSKILDHFVPSGQNSIVVKTKKTKDRYVAEDIIWKKLTDKKIIILVNKWSASASEIFAGTLKDYGNNVVIIWEQSYGKWTVQEVINYWWWSMLKYTVAKRFTGKTETSIDWIGITPDYIISDNPETKQDEQMDAAKRWWSIH